MLGASYEKWIQLKERLPIKSRLNDIGSAFKKSKARQVDRHTYKKSLIKHYLWAHVGRVDTRNELSQEAIQLAALDESIACSEEGV